MHLHNIIYTYIYLDPPRVSNFSPQVFFWWLRGTNFTPLEDSGMYYINLRNWQEFIWVNLDRFHWPGPGVHTSWQRHPGVRGPTCSPMQSTRPLVKSAQQVDLCVRRKQFFSNQESSPARIPMAISASKHSQLEYCFLCCFWFLMESSLCRFFLDDFQIFGWNLTSKTLKTAIAPQQNAATIHTVPAANWPFQLLPMGSLSPTLDTTNASTEVPLQIAINCAVL